MTAPDLDRDELREEVARLKAENAELRERLDPNRPYRPFGKLDPNDPFDQAIVRAWNRGARAAHVEHRGDRAMGS